MHFFNESLWISPINSLKCFLKVQINTIPALVQIMAWHLPDDKPLSETMMVSLRMHICVTRPQWVNSLRPSDAYMSQWTNHHWFIYWLVAWTAPSHHLNQCWNMVNWTLRNKLQWNFNRSSKHFHSRKCAWRCLRNGFHFLSPSMC